jgi:Saxitoxin biosynthesis operon protein SxtJ
MIAPEFPDEAPDNVSVTILRQFAGLCIGIFGLLFVLSWHRHDGSPTGAAWIGLVIAVFVGLPGLIRPSVVRPIYLGLMAVTEPIGHLVSIVILAVIYYGFVTPLAVVFRLTGRDVLLRNRPNVASYWIPRPQPSDPRRYLRQYQSQQIETSDDVRSSHDRSAQQRMRIDPSA